MATVKIKHLFNGEPSGEHMHRVTSPEQLRRVCAGMCRDGWGVVAVLSSRQAEKWGVYLNEGGWYLLPVRGEEPMTVDVVGSLPSLRDC